jgi:hypothetical protein
MLFGKEFKVLKELPEVFRLVGDGYPEYFMAREEDGKLVYDIVDTQLGNSSPANHSDSPYAIKLRTRSEEILRELEREGYIKEIR